MHGKKIKGQLNPVFLLNHISDIIYQTPVVLLFFLVQYLLSPKGKLNTV